MSMIAARFKRNVPLAADVECGEEMSDRGMGDGGARGDERGDGRGVGRLPQPSRAHVRCEDASREEPVWREV